MSEGIEPLSLEPPIAASCQSPRLRGGAGLYRKLFVHSAFLVRPEERPEEAS